MNETLTPSTGTLAVLARAIRGEDDPLAVRVRALASLWNGPVALIVPEEAPEIFPATLLPDSVLVVGGSADVVAALSELADPQEALRAAEALLREAGALREITRLWVWLDPETLRALPAFAEASFPVPIDGEIPPGSEMIAESAELWTLCDSLITSDPAALYGFSAGQPALPVRCAALGADHEELAEIAKLPAFGGAMRVSVIVPVRGHAPLASRLADSLIEHTAHLFELILIDDASPSTRDRALLEGLVRRDVRVRLLAHDAQRGFAASCNRGLAAVRGDVVVVINADTVVPAGWDTRLIAHLARGRAGAVGPMSNRVAWPQKLERVGYDERTLDGFERFAASWARGHEAQATPVVRLTGLCVMIPRPTLRRVGGFDPRFFPGNFEDDDWCVRLLSTGLVPYRADDVVIHHEGSQSFALERQAYSAILDENWHRFRAKWGIPSDRDKARGWDPVEVVPKNYDRERCFIAPWLAQEPVGK